MLRLRRTVATIPECHTGREIRQGLETYENCGARYEGWGPCDTSDISITCNSNGDAGMNRDELAQITRPCGEQCQYQARVDDAFNGTNFSDSPTFFSSMRLSVPGATVAFEGADFLWDDGQRSWSFLGYDRGVVEYSANHYLLWGDRKREVGYCRLVDAVSCRDDRTGLSNSAALP